MPQTEFNLTDVQKIMVGIAYSDGRKIGEQLAAALESGSLKIPDNQTIEIMIDKFVSYDFPAYQKLLAGVIGPKSYAIGNFLCAGGGVMIGGTSVLNFYRTKNPIARVCYGVSAFCGGSATIAGAFTAFNGVCGLSYVAIGGDIIGGSFLWVGNRAKNFGDFIDGKKSVNPFRPKSFVRRPIPKMGTGYKGLSFVPNSGNLTEVLSNIPYTEIIVIGGTIFTIYRSTKLLIKCSRSLYRYVEKKYSPKLNYSHVVRFIAEHLSKAFSMDRVYKIYYLALQL